MKKTILAILAISALALGSCKKGGECGGVSFGISGTSAEITDQTRSRVGDYTSVPAAADFTITLKNASSETVWSGKLSDWNTTTPLAVGEYTVSAAYGSASDEGADKPYFCGAAEFSITDATPKEVTIPVALGNCIVKLECTENFTNYFTSYSFTLKTGADNSFTFSPSQTAPVFMDAYKFTLTGSLVNQGGNTQSFGPKTYENLAAATCYTLKFDASNIGGVTVTITFNNTVETVEIGEIELN